ncbi:unnamed protein product [Paramecium primaurelia]|uniref:Chaperone DnaJ C-terminal domain-containing protein n=1 Tax=Paramecium primaurelia TaxID=5886 RepID=A0A8S1N9T9_PARPR|nr:unnamed protein product [Paramecium primaurelia]
MKTYINKKRRRQQSKNKFYSKFDKAKYETIFSEFDQQFQQKHVSKIFLLVCVTGRQAQESFSCCGSGWLLYIERESSFEKQFDIEIELPPKRIQNGTIIRQTRYGHASQYSGEPADLLIEVEEDNTLRRDGNNIISELD